MNTKLSTPSKVKTNSSTFLAKINPYLLGAISSDDKDFANDTAKLQHVADCFKSEYCYEYNLQRYPNHQVRFAEWLKGLPSCYSIDYENYRIIELAKEWGSLPLNATDKQEDKILDNWFSFIAFKTFQLMRKHKVSPF